MGEVSYIDIAGTPMRAVEVDGSWWPYGGPDTPEAVAAFTDELRHSRRVEEVADQANRIALEMVEATVADTLRAAGLGLGDREVDRMQAAVVSAMLDRVPAFELFLRALNLETVVFGADQAGSPDYPTAGALARVVEMLQAPYDDEVERWTEKEGRR